jgi:hypothetical protein
MLIPIGTTFWLCPECKESNQIDGTELAQIGVPICNECETEMDPQDDPVPTVLLIDGDFVGVALRPMTISRNEFEKKIVKFWMEWDGSSEKTFAEWAEETHGIIFLTSDYIINPIIR